MSKSSNVLSDKRETDPVSVSSTIQPTPSENFVLTERCTANNARSTLQRLRNFQLNLSPKSQRCCNRSVFRRHSCTRERSVTFAYIHYYILQHTTTSTPQLTSRSKLISHVLPEPYQNRTETNRTETNSNSPAGHPALVDDLFFSEISQKNPTVIHLPSTAS